MMNGRNNGQLSWSMLEQIADCMLMILGKKQMAVRIVAHAFEIVHLLTDQNPVQVSVTILMTFTYMSLNGTHYSLVDAIVNTGPREDSTRIGSQVRKPLARTRRVAHAALFC